jgi:hypothetical protein
MSNPRIDPKKSWYDQFNKWVIANGGTDVAPRLCIEGVRYDIPHGAAFGNEDGVTLKKAMEVSAEVVLGKTQDELAKQRFVGPKKMELLGRFLRVHGAKLADGWDGS